MSIITNKFNEELMRDFKNLETDRTSAQFKKDVSTRYLCEILAKIDCLKKELKIKEDYISAILEKRNFKSINIPELERKVLFHEGKTVYSYNLKNLYNDMKTSKIEDTFFFIVKLNKKLVDNENNIVLNELVEKNRKGTKKDPYLTVEKL